MKMEKDHLNDKVLDKEKPYPPSKPVTSTAIRFLSLSSRIGITSQRQKTFGSHDNKETFIKEGQTPIPENVKVWGIEEGEKTVVEKEIQRFFAFRQSL